MTIDLSIQARANSAVFALNGWGGVHKEEHKPRGGGDGGVWINGIYISCCSVDEQGQDGFKHKNLGKKFNDLLTPVEI